MEKGAPTLEEIAVKLREREHLAKVDSEDQTAARVRVIPKGSDSLERPHLSFVVGKDEVSVSGRNILSVMRRFIQSSRVFPGDLTVEEARLVPTRNGERVCGSRSW